MAKSLDGKIGAQSSVTQRFTLLQRLLLTCLVIILLSTNLQIWLQRQRHLAEYEEAAKEENAKTLFYLMHALDKQIADLVANSEGVKIEVLRENYGITPLIDAELRNIDEDEVLKVKIYNMMGVVVYSSFMEEIGGSSSSPDLLSKALRGETVNRIEHRDEFLGKNGLVRDVYAAMTYQPMVLEGRQIGVIEVYDDASGIFQHLRSESIKTFLIVFGSFSLLFAALALSIFRTDRAVAAWQLAVSRSESLLGDILENALDAVVRIDSDGVIIGWNAQAIHTFGWSREEALGRPMHELLMPERYRAAYLQAIKNILATGENPVFGKRIESFAVHRDGRELPVELAITPVKTMPGYEFSVFIRDITERKLEEKAMARHKQVVETSLDGFLLLDMQGNLLEANTAYAGMTGYSKEELRQMHISQLNASEPQEEIKAPDSNIVALRNGRFETRHRKKNGSLMDIEIAIAYMPEEQQFFVFCHDITLRKKNEAALRIAAVTFEARDAIVITDAQANILRVNKAFSDITGYAAEEVLGKNPRIMRSGCHDKNFYVAMWEQLLNSGHWAGEILDQRRNGEIYPKWLTITAIKDDHGNIAQYVGMFSDITERKQREEEIRNLAYSDPLTKLPNRRSFMEHLCTTIAASARYGNYGAVLFIDLDYFKELNDSLGHEYGDLLLLEAGKRIKSCVREMDTVARLGGDEFVVLTEGLSTDKSEAMQNISVVANKIREAMAQPYKLKEHEYQGSSSIGIKLFHGASEPLETLLEHADMAMYQVKRSGRNDVQFFNSAMGNDTTASGNNKE